MSGQKKKVNQTKQTEQSKQNEKGLLSIINDHVFRRIFGQRNLPALAEFLASVFEVEVSELGELIVADPFLIGESEDDKSSILDIRAHTKDGEIINIEVQVLSEISDKTCYPSNFVIRAETRKAT